MNTELKRVAPPVKESDPQKDVNQPTEFSSDVMEGSEVRKSDILNYDDMRYASALDLNSEYFKSLIYIVHGLGWDVLMAMVHCHSSHINWFCLYPLNEMSIDTG
ncbi:unnamed protein product [Cuscuta europaea]|uniref:Uncharacterized protein n=1 Tax=Cuscuta europaea TaxID=41803 RepID=A0A9P0ZQF9_CUSEU|nr:unnamed protein product [Cuscuta europaea]